MNKAKRDEAKHIARQELRRGLKPADLLYGPVAAAAVKILRRESKQFERAAKSAK